jgi:hypothetical protein
MDVLKIQSSKTGKCYELVKNSFLHQLFFFAKKKCFDNFSEREKSLTFSALQSLNANYYLLF